MDSNAKKRKSCTKLTIEQKTDHFTSKQKAERDFAGQRNWGNTTDHFEHFEKKESTLDLFENNCSGDRQRKLRNRGNEDVNRLAWNWFQAAKSKGIPIKGYLLQEKAKFFAERLHLHSFKASNAWLQKFNEAHNISQHKICGNL